MHIHLYICKMLVNTVQHLYKRYKQDYTAPREERSNFFKLFVPHYPLSFPFRNDNILISYLSISAAWPIPGSIPCSRMPATRHVCSLDRLQGRLRAGSLLVMMQCWSVALSFSCPSSQASHFIWSWDSREGESAWDRGTDIIAFVLLVLGRFVSLS